MSQSKIRVALEQKLYELDTTFPTAYENVQFNPIVNTPYQVCRLRPDVVENPTYGDNFHRENGVFEVILCYPQHTGGGGAQDKADEIKEWFYRGLSLTHNDVKVTIRRTVSIGTAYTVNDRYCIPCFIYYYSNQI